MESLADELGTYDVALANINLNVLKAEMHAYAKHLAEDGIIAVSGFYTADVPALRAAAEQVNLKYISETSREDWACVLFVKTAQFA